MTDEFKSRSEMRRVATTHPDALIKYVERLRDHNKHLQISLDRLAHIEQENESLRLALIDAKSWISDIEVKEIIGKILARFAPVEKP